MTWDTIRASIEDEFVTQWGVTTPIAFEDVPFKELSSGAYVRVSVRFDTTENAALGKAVRENGAAFIQVFTPKGHGTATNLQLAEQARAIFQNKTFGRLSFYAGSIRQTGSTENYIQNNVIVIFYYQ